MALQKRLILALALVPSRQPVVIANVQSSGHVSAYLGMILFRMTVLARITVLT